MRVPLSAAGTPLAGAAVEHAALKAWRRIDAGRPALRAIHRLAAKKDATRVYRLDFADGTTVIGKRCRVAAAAVEAAVYEQVLPQLSAPTLRYYGKLDEAATGFSWIFVEEAVGSEYVTEDVEHRAAAARWLAALHTEASALDLAHVLPRRDVGYFQDCLRAAHAAIAVGLANRALTPSDRAVLKVVLATAERLDMQWADIEQFLRRIPSTVVHNDLCVFNLRLRRLDGKLVAMAFDWEDSGWGDAAVDLAQIADHDAYSVMPDLAVYGSEIRALWPHLNRRDLHTLAELGSVFRIVAELHWESWRLSYDYQSERELVWLADYIALGRDQFKPLDRWWFTP
jgi:thiamine kinase-like enzyme